MRRTAVLILVMLALVAPVSGQEPVEAVAMPTDSIDPTQNMQSMVTGGLLGGTLGLISVVTPADRGSYGAAVVGPIAVVAGSIALVGVVGGQGVPAIAIGIAVPVAQLYASILGEQAAMRRRAGGRE